jgi:glycosyltransferase involved in cell wall biosynthesis
MTGRMTESSVCVILPALNEADALPSALAGAPAWARLLVVDNGSTDGTADVARELGADVVYEPRLGFGAACWAGTLAAVPAEVVVFMDADGSFAWHDLESLVDPIRTGTHDLVLGRRHRALRQPGSMPWHIAVANRVLGYLCGQVAGVPLHDLGPFRAIRGSALVNLGITDRTYGWPLEMVLRAARADLRIREVDVTYRPRVGTSKVTGRPWPTLKATVRMLMVLARFILGRQISASAGRHSRA